VALRAAVVVTGFGCRVHVPALRAAGFDVVALVGRDEGRTQRRATRAEVPQACTSLADAIGIGVDAVSVAAPPDAHLPLVLEALQAGAHVLCEKPFALDVAQAQTMHDAATAAGRVGFVAHEFRFAPERALVARLVAEGAIGVPRLATLVHHLDLVADRATPAPPWWFERARGGGWLGASGSHVVDQVRHWLGEVAAVRSAALPRRGADAEDSFTAHLVMESGCEVTLEQCAAAWGPPLEVSRLVGERATLWIDGNRQVHVADAAHPRGRLLDEQTAKPRAPSDDPRHRFTHLELEPFTELCRRFHAAIGGGDPGEAATFADGVAAQRVMDKIRAKGE